MKTLILRIIFCAFAFLFLNPNILTQSNYTSLFTFNRVKTTSQPEWLKASVGNAMIIDINTIQLQQILNRKDNNIRVSVPFDEYNNAELILEKFDITTPATKIVAGTQNGDVPVDISGKFVSYRGKINGIYESLVSITFSNDRITGLVTNQNETYILSKIEQTGTVLYRTSDLKITRNFECGTEALGIPEQITNLQKSLTGNFDASSSTLLKADIAIESDYETFTRFGSVENASIYLISLMSTVSAVYIRDVNVRLAVTYVRVWNTSADPYEGTSSFDFLNTFRGYWNQNMQGIPRALAHYITTRSGNLGGVAWLNSLCASLSNGYGYAFSNINGSFVNLPVYSWDVDVVAHETGHNFGSPHTHNCSWQGGPIDTCYAVEGGCYSGPTFSRIGTIMSYCHLNGGKTLIFGPLPTDLIRQRAEIAGCFSSISGFFVAKPNGGEIFRAGNSTLVIWGTSNLGTVNVELSTNNGSAWQTIQSNVNATDRNITWNVPLIPTTTQALVRVSENGNPVNNDVSDSVFQIRPTLNSYNMISPPMFARIYLTPNDTSKIYFTCTKSGTLPEIKYKWILNNFSNAPIYRQFTNNSGSDTVLSITKGKIDSIISAYGIQTGDSLRGKWLIRSYTLLDSLPPTTSNFIITFIRGLIGINPISTIIPK